jgi:hypothetical protein
MASQCSAVDAAYKQLQEGAISKEEFNIIAAMERKIEQMGGYVEKGTICDGREKVVLGGEVKIIKQSKRRAKQHQELQVQQDQMGQPMGQHVNNNVLHNNVTTAADLKAPSSSFLPRNQVAVNAALDMHKMQKSRAEEADRNKAVASMVRKEIQKMVSFVLLMCSYLDIYVLYLAWWFTACVVAECHTTAIPAATHDAAPVSLLT